MGYFDYSRGNEPYDDNPPQGTSSSVPDKPIDPRFWWKFGIVIAYIGGIMLWIAWHDKTSFNLTYWTLAAIAISLVVVTSIVASIVLIRRQRN